MKTFGFAAAVLAVLLVQTPLMAETDEERDWQALKDMGITPGMILEAVKEEVREQSGEQDYGQYFQDTGSSSQLQQRYWPQEPAAVQLTPASQSGQPSVLVVNAPEQIDFDYFQRHLAPYGKWLEIEGYGRVWQPYVTVFDSSWRPYCQGGQWVWTDKGWYWQSFYSWGWAAFHYGRWAYTPRNNWVWIPDYTWAPAWVTWRGAEGYYGWAPLPPAARYDIGVGFKYNNAYVTLDFDFGLSENDYVYVPSSHFVQRDLHRYWAERNYRHHEIHNQSRVIPRPLDEHRNEVVNYGPSVEEIREAARRRMDSVRIVRRNSVAPVTPATDIVRTTTPVVTPAVATTVRHATPNYWPTGHRSERAVDIVKRNMAASRNISHADPEPASAAGRTPSSKSGKNSAPAAAQESRVTQTVAAPAAQPAPAPARTSSSSSGGRSSRALDIFKQKN